MDLRSVLRDFQPQELAGIQIQAMKFPQDDYEKYNHEGGMLISPELLATMQWFIFAAPLFDLMEGKPATIAAEKFYKEQLAFWRDIDGATIAALFKKCISDLVGKYPVQTRKRSGRTPAGDDGDRYDETGDGVDSATKDAVAAAIRLSGAFQAVAGGEGGPGV